MTKLSELIDESRQHYVTIKGSRGNTWLELSLLWAVLIALAAPQALLLAAVLYLVDVIVIEYDGRPLTFPPEPIEKSPPAESRTIRRRAFSGARASW